MVTRLEIGSHLLLLAPHLLTIAVLLLQDDGDLTGRLQAIAFADFASPVS